MQAIETIKSFKHALTPRVNETAKVQAFESQAKEKSTNSAVITIFTVVVKDKMYGLVIPIVKEI